MVDLDVVVAVPWLAFAMPDLDEPDAAFDEAAGDQNLPGLGAGAIHFLDMFRFAADVEGFGRFLLHAVGEFKRLDPRFQLRFVLAIGLVLLIQLPQKIQLLSLLPRRDAFVFDVFDQFFDGGMLGVDIGSLVDAGEEPGLPVL